MEKLSANINLGCLNYLYPCVCPTSTPCTDETIPRPAPFPPYYQCDISKVVARLAEYEELDLEPDEIKTILKDGEKITEACIRYKNQCVELEEKLKEARAEIRMAWDKINEAKIAVGKFREKADKYDELKACCFSLDDIRGWQNKAYKYDEIRKLLGLE